MKTAHPALRLSLVFLFVLSGLAAPRRAWAQFATGVYRGVENNTGNTFLLRLEHPTALPNSSSLIVGTVFNLEAGIYRVAAGRTDRGGLNIYFSNLCFARSQAAAAKILAAPESAFVAAPDGSLIVNTALIDPGNCCQVEQAGGMDLSYLCAQSGVLHFLRP
jgi:hypothetical protein